MKIQLPILIVLLALSGCEAGSGDELDENGRPLDESIDVPSVGGLQSNLNSIQELVFTPSCSVCHGGANPAAGQDLSSLEKTIESLINVDSSNPLFKRVLPGSSEESYLYLKITGDSRAGARMPLGQPALDEQTITAIKQWIDEGALIPQSAVNMAKISRTEVAMVKVREKTTMNNSAERAITIVFWFNKKMDFQHLTTDQLLVNSSKKDAVGTFAMLVPNEQVSIHVINDQRLQVSVKNIDHDVTKLSIQLNDSNIATMITQQGQMLDGNGDGIEGGVFSYEFIL